MSDVLLLERVVKTYPKGNLRITALAPIDLTVGPGEFVALRGPSGSGKTTCLLVAGGLLHPDSGQVLVDGHDFYAMPRNRLASFRAQNIGFVFQQYHLIPYLTVLENILAPEAAWGRQDNRARGILLAEQFGLAHRLDHTPAELSSGKSSEPRWHGRFCSNRKSFWRTKSPGTWIRRTPKSSWVICGNMSGPEARFCW